MKNKTLIIGKGSIGYRHYEVIKNLYPESDISHISSRKFLEDETVVLDDNFQLTVVAGPVIHRVQTLEKIGENSSFLLIEKPIFGSSNKLNFIETKYNVWVGYNLRFNPLVQAMKKHISTYLSPPIKATFLCESDARTWRSKDYLECVSFNPNLDGGCLNELSHEIDLMYYLFSPRDYTITTRNLFYQDHGLGPIDIGANFSLLSEDLKCDFSLNIASKSSRRFFVVYFKDGTHLMCDLIRGKISGNLVRERAVPRNLPYTEQLRNCKAPNFKTNVMDALNVVKMIGDIKNC